MKIMHCPLNGPRNISEFVYGGEVRTMPDPATCTDKVWADYVFYTDNQAGLVSEWWLHAPSSYWFIAKRDTVSDQIISTCDPAQIFQERIDFEVPETIKEARA